MGHEEAFPPPWPDGRCRVQNRSMAVDDRRPGRLRLLGTLSDPHHPFGWLFPIDWYRDTRNFHIDRAQVVSAGEIEGFPVGPAKGEVGRGGGAVHDAAELCALGIHDPQPTGTAAIDIAFDVDLHAVGIARLRP